MIEKDSTIKIDPQRILIVNLGGIGDILLSLPALKALKSRYANSLISMMIVGRAKPIVVDLPYIDHVYLFSVSSGKLSNAFKNLVLFLKLRKIKFDLGINMRTIVSEASAKKIKWMFDMINPKLKVGRDTDGRGYFFDIKIPEPSFGTRYEMEYDIDTMVALGVDVKNKKIDLVIKEESKRKVAKMLRENNVGDQDAIICIHPGGKLSHRWALDNYSKVSEAINEAFPSKFVVIGGKDEMGLAERYKAITNVEVVDFSGKLTLKETAALISMSKLYIANDTGPMHIAASLDIPLIAIFGPGYFERYDPRDLTSNAVCFYIKQDCAPCDKTECEDMKCLKIISYKDVIEAALELLNRNKQEEK